MAAPFFTETFRSDRRATSSRRISAAAAARADPANASRIAHESSGSTEPSLVVVLDTGTRGAVADLFLARTDRNPAAYPTSLAGVTAVPVTPSLAHWWFTQAPPRRMTTASRCKRGSEPFPSSVAG